MADKRTLLLADDDVVLYAAPTDEALRACFRQAWAIAQQRVAAAGAERVDADGEIHERRWRLTFGEDQEDLTVKQRRFLHGPVLHQIADQVVADGTKFSMPVWKEFYRAKFLGWRWVSMRLPGQKRATPRKVRISTEDLTIRQYSEYIDKVIADAVTEYGVEFDLDPREREAVRYRPKKRAKSAATREEAVTA